MVSPYRVREEQVGTVAPSVSPATVRL
jgi:hypothetical protein